MFCEIYPPNCAQNGAHPAQERETPRGLKKHHNTDLVFQKEKPTPLVLFAFAKSEKEDLSAAERKFALALISEILNGQE
jgi:hypothetical protein